MRANLRGPQLPAISRLIPQQDQQPERGRAARPTPGAHRPSPALRRSWTARAARACSAALRPARRSRRAGWTPGTAAHRSVLHAGFLGRSHNRTRARPRRSQPGRQMSRTSGLVTMIRALGSPAIPANLSGGRCGSLLWRNRSPRQVDPPCSVPRTSRAQSVRQVRLSARRDQIALSSAPKPWCTDRVRSHSSPATGCLPRL